MKRQNESARRVAKMDIRTLGIDLAKNLFQVHGVDGYGRTAAPAPPHAATDIYSAAATMPGGDGGVWQRSLLGPRDWQVRSPGQADECTTCAAVREVQQERCARRRGDLRSGRTAVDALGRGQEPGAAGHAGAASGALTVGPRAHGVDEPDARPAGRVRDRDYAGRRPAPPGPCADPGGTGQGRQ